MFKYIYFYAHNPAFFFAWVHLIKTDDIWTLNENHRPGDGSTISHLIKFKAEFDKRNDFRIS